MVNAECAVRTHCFIIGLVIVVIGLLDCYLFYSHFKESPLTSNVTNVNKTFSDGLWPAAQFSLFALFGSTISFLFCSICVGTIFYSKKNYWSQDIDLLKMAIKNACIGGICGEGGIAIECFLAMLCLWWCGQIGFIIYGIICIFCNVCFLPFTWLGYIIKVLMLSIRSLERSL